MINYHNKLWVKTNYLNMFYMHILNQLYINIFKLCQVDRFFLKHSNEIESKVTAYIKWILSLK